MRSDLLRLVADVEGFGLFRPGEAEGWREDIEAAEVVPELMRINESLLQSIEDRDGYEEFREQVGVSRGSPAAPVDRAQK
ncbi:hypothetical protein ACFQFH_19950 [Halobaculum halobium]|uniref:Uncharacterized protein n=2 Tax=Halobaculum halobium TaxID=3032281 RepID=A0ABD5TH11_9EURY|nr:hypothetical protein [Halobaculum sp. SYNS20]